MGDKCSGLAKLTSVDFCNIDLRDRFGRTPLMYAVLGNYPACVEVDGKANASIIFVEKVLLKTSSNASLVDSSRRTALHWAVHHGHIGCVKYVS